MDNLTMGSLFDGSGGFALGALLEGVTPVWASEIEPFPIRVTTKRLPFMKHYGDISKINGAKIEPVDVVTFGSPCTNMSVAGKREGLNGEQSVLFFEAIRVIKEMRCATDGRYPRFIVWENVPGAYSSAGGSDFREVLSEIVKIKDGDLSVPMPESGKWMPAGEIVGDDFSVAWRTLDAQHFGVPQRRRRCYLVADFDVGCAGKILFESEGVSGYSPQGFGAGQGTAADAEGGAGEASLTVLNDQGGSFMDVLENITGTLRSNEHGHQPLVFEPGAVSRIGGHAWDDAAGTLRADMGDNRLSVAIPINTQIATRHMALGEGTGFGIGEDGDPAFTLQAAHSHAVAVENISDSNDAFAAGFMGGQGSKAGSIGYSENISPTIKSEAGGNSTPCVLTPGRIAALENHPADSRIKLDESGTVQTLTGRMGTGGGNVPLIMNERQYAMTVDSETANSLMGSDYKGAQCVCQPAIVPFRKGTRPHSKEEGQKWETAETANTLNTFDTGESRCNELAVKANVSSVAFGICSDASNSMRSGNPNSGIYQADTSRTLDGNGGNPSCNQGGMAVVALQGSMIGRDDKNGPMGSGFNDDVCFTLNTSDKHAVCYQETVGSLCASDHRWPQQQQVNEKKFIVESDKTEYTVRRLVPQECAMLQGFDPNWCANLETSEPTEADITWWSEVFETHRKIMGTSGKPKSRNQIIKWLQDPHSDAAEYKMWGNGVALPCVRFVMAGIVWAAGL